MSEAKVCASFAEGFRVTIKLALTDFATAERAGQADSMAVLDTYLCQARAA
jgi:hypothetical protein